MSGRPGSLGRAEHDDQREVVGDVLEAVRDTRPYEQHVAGPDRGSAGVVDEGGPTPGHHIHLVLGVRRLTVDAARRDRVRPDRQVVRAELLHVAYVTGPGGELPR